MKKKIPLGILGGLAAGAIGVGGAAAIGNYFYDLAMVPKKRETAMEEDESDPVAQGREWLRAHPRLREVSTPAVDGLELHAWLIRSADPSCHRWAVCIHGYHDSARSMGTIARHYEELGWNVLLPDLRGHGKSGGDYVGFGWDDRLDMVCWCSRIIRRDAEAQIILHGVSMGAATALMTTGGPVPPNVRGVVSDSSYTTALEIMRHVYQHIPNHRHLARPAANALRAATRRRAKYDPIKADARTAVSRSHTPTLFIHGAADDFVPPSMMTDLYDHANCPKEFLWVPGAGHARAVVADPELYWSTVDTWVEKVLDTK